MPHRSSALSIIPSLIGGVLGFVGAKLLIAILFGFITKTILYYFDEEIKVLAIRLKKYIKKLRKK